MRPASALVKLVPLLKKPYFTSKEVRDIGVHPAILTHYVKTGCIRRVQRGVYQKVNYQNPSAFLWEDLIEAVHSIKGGVVCLISALAIYDLTEEIPRQHWIAIRHGTSTKRIRGIKVARYRNIQLGKTEIELEGIKIPIFDRERTIIDAFRLLSRETAIKALKAGLAKKGKNRIDLVKLQAYAKKLRFDITPYLLSLTI
ncbi:MAG TPA: type IV toxin-antitoxin system AbiEi family antitoxin domain-containing protein [Rhabdochlamydiaceae bacterium]|nr:type IV toxin-antitoxin system AbiEi family antitoxin domain-containing protein [Rhabdochlamydiaceae bacterium]